MTNDPKITLYQPAKNWRKKAWSGASLVNVNSLLEEGWKFYVPDKNGQVFHRRYAYHRNGDYSMCKGGYSTKVRLPSMEQDRYKKYTPCASCFASWTPMWRTVSRSDKTMAIAKNVWTGEVDTIETPKSMKLVQTLEFETSLTDLVQQLMATLRLGDYKVKSAKFENGIVKVVATK